MAARGGAGPRRRTQVAGLYRRPCASTRAQGRAAIEAMRRRRGHERAPAAAAPRLQAADPRPRGRRRRPGSNRRWAPDGFGLPCRNGEAVLVATVTRDREAMSWVAAVAAGTGGGMVRDVTLDRVERRSGSLRARRGAPVRRLADNASVHAAAGTSDLADGLALVPCSAPVRNPNATAPARPP